MALLVVPQEQRGIQDNQNFKDHLKDSKAQEQKESLLLNPHPNMTLNSINEK